MECYLKHIGTHITLNSPHSFFCDKYVYDEYQEIKMHTHEFIEIVYVAEGKGIHRIGNKQHEVSKGNIYILNTDIPHSFYPNNKENTDGLMVFNCMFNPDFVCGIHLDDEIFELILKIFILKSFTLEDIEKPDFQLTDTFYGETEAVYNAMFLELDLKRPAYMTKLKFLLCQLLIILYRAYVSKNEKNDQAYSYKNYMIYESIRFLENNYSEKLSLKDISRNALLSKSYFASTFKRQTGMTVFEYIQKLRVDKACELLMTTERHTVDIALMVGYSEYNYFYKIFKKITGISPMQYRKKYVTHN